jgi:hypothetical protein
MNSQIMDIFKFAKVGATQSQNSRYRSVESATIDGPDGRKMLYLKRRFVPPPEHFFEVQEHTVIEGERPDIIAAKYFGDPEQFWRLSDANRAMDPFELTDVPGRRLRITLPEGIAGERYV